MAYIALLLSVAVVAADQICRILAVEYLKPVGTIPIIKGLLDFRYIENTGAAFSILQDQRWFFVTVTAVICVLVVFALFRYHRHEFFSYGASILILGGGIGNLIDRVFYGYVVDYIRISFFPAIFNFSDCCITVGALFLIVHVLFYMEGNGGAEKVLRTK